MKAIGKILGSLLVLGLLALAAYAIYHYLLPRWVGILFYAYIGCGLLIWVIGIFTVVSEAGKSGNFKDDFTKMVQILAQKSDLNARLGRLREAIGGLGRILGSAIVWPVDVGYGILESKRHPGMTQKQVNLRLGLSLLEHYYSLFALLAVVALLGLDRRGVKLGRYEDIVLAMLLASVTLRHIRYSIQTTPFPAHLRRVSANPYVAFLVIIAADFTTLVLALTALGRSGSVSAITLGDLWATGAQLLKAKEPLKVLQGTRLTEHQLLVGFVGLLFYLALLKTLTEFKEFKRTDGDYVWLATAANALGNFAAALRHLRKVESWNADARATEIVALLGVNEIDAAEEKVGQLIEYNHKDRSPEAIFGIVWSACLMNPISNDTNVSIFQHALRSNMQDAFVQDSAAAAGQIPEVKDRVRALFDPVKQTYPLTWARLSILAGEPAAAVEFLRQIKPTALLDEVVGMVLQMLGTISNPEASEEEAAKYFREWVELAIPKIRALMRVEGKSWERTVTFSQIMAVLTVAREATPERVEELTFLADSFKDKTEASEAQMGMKFVEMSLQKHAAAG